MVKYIKIVIYLIIPSYFYHIIFSNHRNWNPGLLIPRILKMYNGIQNLGKYGKRAIIMFQGYDMSTTILLEITYFAVLLTL